MKRRRRVASRTGGCRAAAAVPLLPCRCFVPAPSETRLLALAPVGILRRQAFRAVRHFAPLRRPPFSDRRT
jgi:hypothetical protein